jgi:hypothetical protein
MVSKNKSNFNLSTAQLCALTHISVQSAYEYYRIYPEFFSPITMVIKPGPPGRAWSMDDLQLIWTLRFFRNQRLKVEKIKEILGAGFRVQSEPWNQELVTSLISDTLAAMDQARIAYQEAGTIKEILSDHARQNDEFKKLWIWVNDMRWEWRATQKVLGTRTELVKYLRIKKHYHGEPPELYSQEK